ncbi:MAG: FecR domain-containing protein [Lachnospiraceae bacterium]
MDKSHKKKLILISSSVLLIAAVAIIVLFVVLNKKDAYRNVKVYEVSGEATITRDGVGEIEAYQDMVLESGDTVVVKSGKMTLRLDDDKYVYVESDTEFKLVAEGNSANSKTSIELSYGAITNDIQNALSEDSSYEVNTPNSNMSVRGTIYRVHIYYVDGVRYTKVSVFEGEVDSYLRYPDGRLSKNSVIIKHGKEVIIYDDDTNTDYLSEPGAIDYAGLPEDVINLLREIMENGEDIGIPSDSSDKDTKSEANGPFTVTFMYNGSVFGTQTVEKGGQASVPSLAPAQSGSWNFDFSTEITKDTTIQWK